MLAVSKLLGAGTLFTDRLNQGWLACFIRSQALARDKSIRSSSYCLRVGWVPLGCVSHKYYTYTLVLVMSLHRPQPSRHRLV